MHSHWSSALPISPQLASPKQPVWPARAREAGPRGCGWGWGGASTEAGAAAASGSGSGLERSILAAAATAAAPGQVKRTLSVLLAVCPASSPSRPKVACSASWGFRALGKRRRICFARLPYLPPLLRPFLQLHN